MSLRVIAGSAKGRRLKKVPGDTTRPIMDRVKEALFNIIGTKIVDATFLDLFGGTGSVGIEALSRGARQAVFIERDKLAYKTIQANLELTKLRKNSVLHRMDAFDYLKRKPAYPFDFIYIAPPQYKTLWKQSLDALEQNPGWLHDNTRVIIQIDPKEHEQVQTPHLIEVDRRKYGNTLLLFLQTQVPPANSE